MIGLEYIDMSKIMADQGKPTGPSAADYRDSFDAANKMTTSFKNTGAAGLRADVEICYEAAARKPTLKVLASCYIADQGACDLEAAAGKRFGMPLPDVCLERAISRRVNSVFDKLRTPAEERTSLTALWRGLSKKLSFD